MDISSLSPRLTVPIRPANLRDKGSFPEIERAAGSLFRSWPDLAWIADDAVMSAEAHAKHVEAGTVWVAMTQDKAPAGFLTAEIIGEVLHIWQLCVHPDAQRQGIGAALIDTAAKYARAERLREITLTTFRDVPWNEPYYARLGFRTLEDDGLSERLRGILGQEVAQDLPADQRCVMTLPL